MRERKSYPNTPPTPSDRFNLTEKGLHACAAMKMEKAVAQLRQMADELEQGAEHLSPEMSPPKKVASPRRRRNGQGPKIFRYGTVCGRYRDKSERRVSDMRLCGLWLKAAGFDIGQKYEVEVEAGKLTVRAVVAHPKRRTTVAGAGPKQRRSEAKVRTGASRAGSGVSRRA